MADDGWGKSKMAAALKPFGWTCTEDFWRRYYTDPWVFNLANAVEGLTDALAAEQRRYDELLAKVAPDLAVEFPRTARYDGSNVPADVGRSGLGDPEEVGDAGE